MARPTDEQIKLMRDAMLESYVRRNPQAQPEPGTSLYAIIEACAGPIAAVMANVPGAEDAIFDFLEEDRQTVIEPAPDDRAFVRLENVTERDETGEPVATEPNAERDKYKAGEEWPCQRNAEGSF